MFYQQPLKPSSEGAICAHYSCVQVDPVMNLVTVDEFLVIISHSMFLNTNFFYFLSGVLNTSKLVHKYIVHVYSCLVDDLKDAVQNKGLHRVFIFIGAQHRGIALDVQ